MIESGSDRCAHHQSQAVSVLSLHLLTTQEKGLVSKPCEELQVEKKESGSSTRAEGTEPTTKETEVGRKVAERGWSAKLEFMGIERVD